MTRIRQFGLSLVELMIALALATALVAGVLAVFLSSRQTSLVSNAFSGIQENARFVTRVVGYDVAHAGHFGCKSDILIPVAASGADADNFKYVAAISGWSSGATPAWFTPALKPGTDILKVQYASPNAYRLTVAMAATTSALTFGGAGGTPGTGPIVIADCASSEIFSFTAAPTASGVAMTGQPSAALTKKYDKDTTEVMPFVNHIYYVGTDSILHRINSATATPEDIADNVEDFAAIYGVDTDGDNVIDKYVSTPSGTMAVMSVQLCLLLTNTDKNISLAPPTATYTDCHGNAKTNTSKAFHQLFRTTVARRNGLV
ncbi:MAG TPA: PilW family protein [Rhodocyclaceae bacterium]